MHSFINQYILLIPSSFLSHHDEVNNYVWLVKHKFTETGRNGGKMSKKLHIGLLMLILISITAADDAVAWEDANNDGVIIRMCPPPGREWVYDPRIGWHEIVTGYPLEDMMNDLDDWDVTRATIDYFGYTSWILNDKFSDSLLTSYFTQINTWGLNFDLGVIAIKDLPGATTGEQCYAIEQSRIIRFDSLGADLASLTIDEPYTATIRGNLYSSSFPQISGLDYAVRETADWLELVRADSIMGQLDVCLIESYPRLFRRGRSNRIH